MNRMKHRMSGRRILAGVLTLVLVLCNQSFGSMTLREEVSAREEVAPEKIVTTTIWTLTKTVKDIETWERLHNDENVQADENGVTQLPDGYPISFKLDESYFTEAGKYDFIYYDGRAKDFEIISADDGHYLKAKQNSFTMNFSDGTSEQAVRYPNGTFDIDVVDTRNNYEVVQRITITVKDFFSEYGNYVVNKWIEDNHIRNLPKEEQFEAAVRFVSANYSYDTQYRFCNMNEMMLSGAGDCWASSQTIVYICKQLDIPCRLRMGAHESSSSQHVNVVALINDMYYVGEAGVVGNAPRPCYIYAEPKGYLTEYDSETEGWKILQYDGFDKEITIPEELSARAMVIYNNGNIDESKKIYNLKTQLEASDKHKVTAIGSRLSYHSGIGVAILNFYNGTDTKYDIYMFKSVRLPETVKKIDEYAFGSSYNLESIYIPASVESIGDCPFGYCNKLKSENIELGSESRYRVDTDKKALFTDDDKTLVMVLPDSTDENYAIPEGVTRIRKEAFVSASAKTVSFPTTLDTIHSGVFTGSHITGLTIPGTVRTIETSAFQEAWELNSVIMEDGVESIAYKAFYNTENLRVIQIPASVTYIGDDAFKAYRKNPMTIYGKTDSTAYTYATNTNNEIPFKTIGEGYLLDITMEERAEDSFTYNYYEQTPTITITFAGKKLTAGVDYDINWDSRATGDKNLTDARTIYYTVTGKGTYAGSYENWYAISKSDWGYQFSVADMDYGTNPMDMISIPSTNSNDPDPEIAASEFWYQEENTDAPNYWFGYMPSNPPQPGKYKFQIEIDGDNNHKQYIGYYTATVRPVELQSIAIRGSEEVTVNRTVKLSVDYTPTNTSVDKTVEWSSSDPNVAEVDANGRVKGKMSGESATITAKVGDKEAAHNIKVVEPYTAVTDMTVDGDTDIGELLYVNRTRQLTATITPTDASNSEVEWSSSNPEIATVDENGLVTAVNVGDVTITAKSVDNPSLTKNVNFHVQSFGIRSILIQDGSEGNASGTGTGTLVLGDSKKLTATVSVSSADATDAEKQIQWVSTNPDIASVEPDGTVTANGRGTAYIIPMLPAINDDENYYVEKGYRYQVFVRAKSLSTSNITVSEPVDQTYSGEPCYQFPTVMDGDTVLKSGIDYMVSYEDNINVGTAKMIIQGIGNYSGGGTSRQFYIDKADYTESLVYDEATQTYKANEKAKSIKIEDNTVTSNGYPQELATVLPAEYDPNIVEKVEYYPNFKSDSSSTGAQTYSPKDPGEYSYIVRYTLKSDLDKNYYMPEQEATLTILRNINWYCNASLDQTSYTYTGQAIEPVPTVKENGVTLVEGADYTVTYQDNVNVGTGKVILNGAGNYGGTLTLEFEINSANNPILVSDIQLNKEEASIEVGGTVTLTPSISPSNATNKNVTWESSNPSAATVSNSGVVKGVAEGATWITCAATDGSSKVGLCKVTVTKPVNTDVTVEGLSLNPTKLSLKPGETARIGVSVVPTSATNKNVTWSSSNTGIATVSSSGVVTARKAGTAVITCTSQADATKKAACTITVKNPSISGVSLSASSMSLRTGENRAIQAYASPSNAVITGVVWKSSNTGVVAISGSGSSVTLQARGAGTATISCLMNDDNGKSAYGICNVTVAASEVKATGITLNQSSVSVELGSTTTLAATVSPADATNRNVTWLSSDTGVATVSSSGVVTGIREGTATITCMAADGSGRSASCTVKVTDYTPTEAFSARLYEKCLGREPEEAGLEHWDEVLVNKERSGAQVAYGFVFSAEYKSKNTSNEEYVDMLYRVFMDREADAGGREHWVNYLENGMSREYVFRGFAQSAEYTGICNNYGIIRGEVKLTQARDQNPKLTAYVNRMYTQALARPGEEDGLNHWCKTIQSKSRTPEQVAESFINSREFKNKNLNDEEYVKVLYRTFMGREADASGLQHWKNELARGCTREEILHRFATSKEFRNIQASFGL